MARPTKFSKERAQRIVDALKTGNTRRASAAYGGISEDTLARWIESNAGFAEQVELAEAECEVAMAAIIRKAALGQTVKKTKTTKTAEATITVVEEVFEYDWRAAETWLKRRKRADWGDSIDVRRLDDETLIRLLERDAQARGGTAQATDSSDNAASGS